MKTTNVFLNGSEQMVKIDDENAKTVHKRVNENLFDTLHNMLMGDIDRVELNIHTNRYVTNKFVEKDKYLIIKHTVNNTNMFLNYNPLYHLSYDDYKVDDDRKSRKINNNLKRKYISDIYVFEIHRFNSDGKMFRFHIVMIDWGDQRSLYTINPRYSNRIKMEMFENYLPN